MKATRVLLASRQQQPPFANLKVAISIYSKNEGDDEKDAFKSVVERVKSLGAEYSAIVHKRINFLVASKDAVDQRTQRIRKALKFSVPILSLDFVDACERATKFVDHDPFLVDVPPPPPTEKRPIEHRAEIQSAKKVAKVQHTVDLGCCCSCHDSGKAYCEWCVHIHIGGDEEASEERSNKSCRSETDKATATSIAVAAGMLPASSTSGAC